MSPMEPIYPETKSRVGFLKDWMIKMLIDLMKKNLELKTQKK